MINSINLRPSTVGGSRGSNSLHPATRINSQRKTCLEKSNVKKIVHMNDVIHEAKASRDTQILEDMSSLENTLLNLKFKSIATNTKEKDLNLSRLSQ